MFSISFYKLATICPCRRTRLFIWKKKPRISSKNLNSIHPRMLCAKFGLNWPSSFKERILKYFQYNFTISLLSSLVEGHGRSFEKKNESPLPKDQVWLKLAQLFWRRSWKCEKFTDGQTDDRQQAIRKDHLSFHLRWAKNSWQGQTKSIKKLIKIF